jgi:mannose-6-phosphate isomerase-like protein (cupin superfamily)
MQKQAKINFDQKFKEIDDYWSPRIVAQMNNYEFKIAKTHRDTDETFIVLDGNMTIKFRDKEVFLQKGEMFVVPSGAEHKPSAKGECKILIVEPKGVRNTGEIENHLTSENGIWV